MLKQLRLYEGARHQLLQVSRPARQFWEWVVLHACDSRAVVLERKRCSSTAHSCLGLGVRPPAMVPCVAGLLQELPELLETVLADLISWLQARS